MSVKPVEPSGHAPISDLERCWLETLESRAQRSLAADDAAAQHVASGQRRRFSSGMPFPIYVASGAGAHIQDIDGNRFIDLTAGWNASILGRGNAAICDAVTQVMASSGVPGGAMHPTLHRDALAETLCELVPGADRVVFAPSGSEANAYALRLARAYTGNSRILRMEGGWHGQNDYLLAGESRGAGLPPGVEDAAITVPYNNIERCAAALEEFGGELCAVIVEPMMTIPGAVHQRNDFLPELRREALRRGIPFILDEVITYLRFGLHGAGGFYSLDPPPDLVVVGKMVGGGLPVAAVLGREAIIEQPISASNTHAQHDVCMVAALSAIHQLTEDGFARLHNQGATLRAGLRDVCAGLKTPIQVTGDGPCAGIHFTVEDVVDDASARRADARLWRLMCLGMLVKGVSLSSRTFGVTMPFTDDDVTFCLDSFREVLSAVDEANGREPT